jgi:surface protein
MTTYQPKTKDELNKAISLWCDNEKKARKKYGDTNAWDVKLITDMSLMFLDSEFNGDISNWNVSKVTDMNNMFWSSKFNGDISKWNVSNVTDMNCMFGHSLFNGDISNWDVSNVKNMGFMFYRSQFNGDISAWDVSNVTYMRSMFTNSIFKGDISIWDVSNVTNMESMFYSSEFKGDLSNWNLKSLEYGKDDVSKYINIKWKEERVTIEELICNVYYEHIYSKYVKCDICKNVFDECIKEEWISNNKSCPMCRSEWRNNTVYLMVN